MLTEEEKLKIYAEFNKSRHWDYTDELIFDFLMSVYKESKPEDIIKLKKDFFFVEKDILKCMLSLEKLDIKPQYMSLYARRMNSKIFKTENPTIVFDELLQFTIKSFYLLVFSLANDRSDENFEKCFKNCVMLLELQGNRHELATYSYEKLVEMCKYPKNILDLSMDAYWVSWTFIVAHELYHVSNNTAESSYQEELDSDKYAYTVIINMIQAQKQDKTPKDLDVFHEYLYLAPLMMLEFFKLLDFYNNLFGKKAEYIDYPSPELRQEKLFDMFDEYIPNSFDTVEGNGVFNCFLDEIDFIKEQLKLKKENGELDRIREN